MMNLRKFLLMPLFILSLVLTSAARPRQAPTLNAPGGIQLHITQVDKSQFPQVTVYVSATDSYGAPAIINPANLMLQENGRVITPDAVNGTGEGGALTTLLAIDISGSMNTAGKLGMAKSVAQTYIHQIRADDHVAILAFNETSSLVQNVTSDQQTLSDAVDGLRASGDTAMYDTLLKGIEILNPLPGRKAIIVLTDGLDNHSKHDAVDVLKAIGESGLSISTIGLGKAGQSTGNLTALDETGLSALAEQAGGQYGYANNLESLQSLYEQYGRSLKSEYAITYTSPSALHDGFNRSLTVSLVNGNLSALSNLFETKYNPGGVLPEDAVGGRWGIFILLFAVLLIVLSAPAWIGVLKTRKLSDFTSKLNPTAKKTKPRIKLT
ncbi:MAG: hypothetical protein C0391_04290 [Anaerolinea sp.]|nr:hypothetical protein [Anaerolinea sp.]